MKPLVSILIPAYNAGTFIAATLESAAAQTWPNKEIIVVDDGSKDNTREVADRFASESIRVYTQKNQGAAAARNTAFSHSRGDFVQWLDADDFLSPDKIERQMNAFERCPDSRTLLSSEWGEFLHRPHRARFIPTALWCDLSPTEWLTRKMELNLHMQTATWLVSRELTEAAGPWDTRLLSDDDGEYFNRVLMASERVLFVPKARVYYRATGAGSLSYIGRSDEKIKDRWRSMQIQMHSLRSRDDSPRVRRACITYMQNWLIYFYPEKRDIIREAEQMAAELGGRLEAPRLSWKYAWIRAMFGWEMAKYAQVHLQELKASAVRSADRALLLMERSPALAGTPR